MTALLTDPVTMVSLPGTETDAARDSSIALAEFVGVNDNDMRLRVEDPETGRHVDAAVPAAALRLLASALARMAEGRSVTLAPLDADLSTQQAADLLGVSYAYVVKLLEEGKLPCDKTSSERRVRVDDLRRYMASYQKEAVHGLQEITAEAQRVGLYE